MTKKKPKVTKNVKKVLASAIAASTLLIPAVASATDYTIDGTTGVSGVANGGTTPQMTVTNSDLSTTTGTWNKEQGDIVTMTGGTLDVSGYDGSTDALTNGIITATGGSLNISGGQFNTTGSSITDVILTNAGTITGTDTIGVAGASSNVGLISSAINVASGATFTTAGFNGSDSGLNAAVTNAGTLELTGGTITGAVSGSGTTSITGNVSNSSTISGNDIEITSTGKLSTIADKVIDKDGTITNSGTLELTGGTAADATVTSASNTSGSGKIIIDGFINQTGTLNTTSTAADAIKVNSGKYLKTDAANLGASTDNQGTLELTGGTLASAVAGTGSTTINTTSTVTNTASIAQAVNVTVGEFINSTGGSITGDLTVDSGTTATVEAGSVTNVVNNGTFNLEGGSVAGTYTQTVAGTNLNITDGSALTVGTGSSITNGAVTLGDTSTTGMITLNNGGVNSAVITTNSASVLDVKSGSTFNTGAGSSIASAAAITVAGNLGIQGTGTTVALNNNDTWSGGISVSGGQLDIADVIKLGTLTQTDGTVNVTSAQVIAAGDSITGGTFNVGAKLDVTGGIITAGDSAAKVVIASGTTMDIKGDSNVTLDGGSDLSRVDWQGDVKLTSDDASLTLANIKDTSRFTGGNKTGTLDAQKGHLTIDNTNVLLGDNDLIAAAVDLALTGDLTVTSNASATIDSSDTWTSGNIIQTANGALTLDGVSTGAGKSVQSSGGTLNVLNTVTLNNASDTIAAATALNVASGNTLNIQNTSDNGVTVNAGDTWGGMLQQSGGTLTITGRDDTTTNTQKIVQTAGNLNLDNTKLNLKGNSSVANAALKNSTSLTYDNAANNTAVITTDNTANSLTVGGDNTTSLTLSADSNISSASSVTVKDNGALNSSDTIIKAAVTNDGTYKLTNGTISNAIKDNANDGSKGTLNLIGATTSTALGTIMQKDVKVDDGTFTMGANLTAANSLTITDDGAIANATGTTITAGALSNDGSVTGGGNLVVNNGGYSTGAISQKDITLNNGAAFDNGSTMTTTGTFINHTTVTDAAGTGTLTAQNGGSSDGAITQATIELTGGAFTNTANMTANTKLDNAAALKNSAKITAGQLANTGTIDGVTVGTTTTYGDLEVGASGGSSSGAIHQATIDLKGGNFTNSAAMTAETELKNNSTLANSSNITAKKLTNTAAISGTGNLEVGTNGGSSTASISQTNVTLNGGTFDNTSTLTSTGIFTNHATVTGDNGTLNIVSGVSNGSGASITQGIIAITGAFNNNADMTAKTLLDIASSATVINDATITAAKFENDGTINQETTAGGTVKIAGTGSYNAGTITQALTEITGGTFTNDTTGKIYGTTFKNDADATTTNKGDIGSSSSPVTTVQNDGTFTNDTAGEVFAGTLDNNNSMTNKNIITATIVENDGTYKNDGATSSLIATTINNNTGSFTNDGSVGSTTTPVTTLNNFADFTNNLTGTVLATTIDNKSGGTYTNSGKTGTAANPVTTITNNGTAFVNNGGASIVATNVTNNTSMTNKAGGTIDSVNYTNNKTLANNGTINSTGTFTNAATGTIGNGGTEGEGTINVNNGSNAGTITQGNFTIAASNTGFTNDKTMTIETALNNNGNFNNTDTVNVQNSTNNAAFTNAGTYNSTGAATQAKTNADNVINTGATMNLTKSDIVVGYQAGDIMGTINIKGTSVADVVNLDIQGTNPNIGGTVNVGSSTETATANLKAGNIIETAILSVASGSVLNVDNSAAPTAPTSVVVNTNDTYSGDITLAAGDVTLKDISVATGDTSTTAGGTKPYYAQTGGNLLLDNSTMSMANAAKISGGNMNVNDTSTYIAESGAFNVNTLQNSGLVQVINGGYDNYGMNNLVVGSATDTQGDFTADLYARSNTNKKYDSYGNSSTVISAGNASLNGTVNISDWKLNGNLMGKDAPIDREIYFTNMFAGTINPGDTINFTATNKKVFTPIGNYRVSHAGGGTFKLELADYNPQVFRGQVTKLAQYQNQLAIDDMLFTHSMTLPSFKDEDGGMSKAMMANRYAGAGDLYAPYQYSRKDGGLWFKSYGNFEHLNMSHGLDVGNNGYGSLIGADFGLKELKNGWKFMPTAYIGYNGAHQYFNRVSAYQNGGQLGLMGTWYKGNFLIGALGYAGIYNNHMTVKNYSSEDSLGYFAGGSVKTAYNWRIHKDVVIQPNLMAAYNFFGKENWHTDFGQMGMMSGMLHGVNIAPGINLIWEKETFSTYLTVQYMYNVNQSLGGRAGNVYLPRVAMDRGYIQYGIGVTKKMTDRVSGYAQAVFRNAGRTGVGFQAGLEILLGKDKK